MMIAGIHTHAHPHAQEPLTSSFGCQYDDMTQTKFMNADASHVDSFFVLAIDLVFVVFLFFLPFLFSSSSIFLFVLSRVTIHYSPLSSC